ncbi:hypothetical protein T10_2058 [Trichinella papuae]|uniref:Uncharacterized protein n=1 Tax=Trichinella papuae TaxID=268474 RepID=A0A0V1MSD2_9BILA|nr:hypothetical protein T10_2058 [Trichinella papuae]
MIKSINSVTSFDNESQDKHTDVDSSSSRLSKGRQRTATRTGITLSDIKKNISKIKTMQPRDVDVSVHNFFETIKLTDWLSSNKTLQTQLLLHLNKYSVTTFFPMLGSRYITINDVKQHSRDGRFWLVPVMH